MASSELQRGAGGHAGAAAGGDPWQAYLHAESLLIYTSPETWDPQDVLTYMRSQFRDVSHDPVLRGVVAYRRTGRRGSYEVLCELARDARGPTRTFSVPLVDLMLNRRYREIFEHKVRRKISDLIQDYSDEDGSAGWDSGESDENGALKPRKLFGAWRCSRKRTRNQ